MVEETKDNPTTENNANTHKSSKTPLTGFVEHQIKAAEETVKALKALIPPDFSSHSAEARKEFIESFKVLVEGAAANLDQEFNRMRGKSSHHTTPKNDGGASSTGKTKVKVEVN